MPTGRRGSIHLFRFAGVDVFLHWSWFVVALFEINARAGRYTSVTWNVMEYVALFLIVLLHEFGHALACRQVGGRADHIVLWPLGGVAYVDPPPRPGATLWSITAGPLVNVVLLPILWVLAGAARSSGGNLERLLQSVLFIDAALLIFNILPIFPLDGGQILRALLWFVLGRARSLLVATVLGFVGVLAFLLFAFYSRSLWLAALGVFMLLNCWGGLKHSLYLLRIAKLPRREGFSCPFCRNAPPMGELWTCPNCHTRFDTFATQAVCPGCGAQFASTQCMDCGRRYPMSEWMSRVGDEQVLRA